MANVAEEDKAQIEQIARDYGLIRDDVSKLRENSMSLSLIHIFFQLRCFQAHKPAMQNQWRIKLLQSLLKPVLP